MAIKWKRQRIPGQNAYRAEVCGSLVVIRRRDELDLGSPWIATVSGVGVFDGVDKPVSADFPRAKDLKERVELASQGLMPLVFGREGFLICEDGRWIWKRP